MACLLQKNHHLTNVSHECRFFALVCSHSGLNIQDFFAVGKLKLLFHLKGIFCNFKLRHVYISKFLRVLVLGPVGFGSQLVFFAGLLAV